MTKNKKQLLIIAVAALIGGAALVGAYTLGVVHQKNAQSSQASQLATSGDERSVDIIDAIATTDSADGIAVEEDMSAEVEAPKPVAAPVQPAPSKPASQPEKKPMQGIVVSNLQYVVQADNVVFTFALPGSFNGDCKIFLQKDGDKAGAWHYSKSAGARSSCTVTIARSQLSTGTWHYEAAFLGDSVYSHQNPKGSLHL